MDVLQGAVLHRKGKKWKSRWAVLKTSPVSDSIGPTLILYKDASHAQSRQHKHIWPLWRYAGSAVFGKVEKTDNVLMIFTETHTIVLAFENQVLLNEWHCFLQNEFGAETTFRVVVPPKQKIKVGEATLYICKSFFSIINDKSYRCAGRWPCSALYRYATIENDFVLETSTFGHVKGHTFRLQTKQSEEIAQTFDAIKEAETSEMKEKLKNQLNPGSGLLLDMDQGRRYTASSSDQNVFQRAFLRVSNRFRRNKRARAATVGTQRNPRRERLKELNQSSNENPLVSQDTTDGNDVIDQGNISQLPDEIDSKANAMPYKSRCNSHGDFTSESTRPQARVKAVKKPEPLTMDIAVSDPVGSSKSSSPVKKISSTMGPQSRALKSSVGSASGISTESRGVSMCSDVFDDDASESKNNRQPKLSGPPVAPPRSPISLGIFDFPSKANACSDKEERETERDYLNKDDLTEIAMRRASENDNQSVSLRKKTCESSLLEEIDREIKRRTREGESFDDNDASSPISPIAPYQSNVNHSDNEDSGEAYVFLRTTDLGTQYPQIEARNKENANDNHERNNEKISVSSNADPGVHSPNYTQKDETQTEYENVSKLMNGSGSEEYKSKGRRNSSRRASSKHLSDPIIIERFVQSQQQIQDNIVTGSLRELPQETNYVNVQGSDERDDASVPYVNMAAGGPAERKLRKGRKPSPLNLNRTQIHWDKYDDDDKIYHDVGPLISNGKSGSVDGLGSYKNISDGSYENISARPVRDRAYVNLPSPSHKKPATMLNYVLVNGKTGAKGSSNNRTNKMGSSNSVNFSKSDYSMIDEKATSLLQKTREQHWQRREEDAQAQLNTPTRKAKKSQGD